MSKLARVYGLHLRAFVFTAHFLWGLGFRLVSRERFPNDAGFLYKYFSCNVEIGAAHTTL